MIIYVNSCKINSTYSTPSYGPPQRLHSNHPLTIAGDWFYCGIGWLFISERLTPRQLLPTDGQGRAGRPFFLHGDEAVRHCATETGRARKLPVAGCCLSDIRAQNPRRNMKKLAIQSGSHGLPLQKNLLWELKSQPCAWMWINRLWKSRHEWVTAGPEQSNKNIKPQGDCLHLKDTKLCKQYKAH